MGDTAALAAPTVRDGEQSVAGYFHRARHHLSTLGRDDERAGWLRAEQARFEREFARFEAKVLRDEPTKETESAWAYSETICTLASLASAYEGRTKGLPYTPEDHLDRYLRGLEAEAPKFLATIESEARP